MANGLRSTDSPPKRAVLWGSGARTGAGEERPIHAPWK
jgi:hypothetical protein